MRKFAAILLFILAFAACQSNQKHINPFVENNIESYDVWVTDYNLSQKTPVLTNTFLLNKDGNTIQEINHSTNVVYHHQYKDSLLQQTDRVGGTDSLQIRYAYQGNKTTEDLYINGILMSQTVSYTNSQKQDTLQIRYDAQNDIKEKTTKIYDELGLRETIKQYTTNKYTITRTKGDKRQQVYVTKDSQKNTISTTTYTYDDNGNQIEYIFDAADNQPFNEYIHTKTTYLDNGLKDKEITLNRIGETIKEKQYKYKQFAKK